MDNFDCCKSNNVEGLQTIIGSDGNNEIVHIRNKDGNTPLHSSAMYNSKECLEILITHGGDVTIRDDKGNTPLDYLEESYKNYIMKLVEEVNAFECKDPGF